MSAKTNTVEIHKGEDKVLVFTIREKESGDAIDLTTALLSVVTFQGETSDVIKIQGSGVTITDGPKGKMQVVLSEVDTALLKAGNNLDFKVKYDIGTNTTIKKVKRKLNVIDPDLG